MERYKRQLGVNFSDTIYFIIYFMLGLPCFVEPGSELLKGIHHAEPLCSALDGTVYESCKK